METSHSKQGKLEWFQASRSRELEYSPSPNREHVTKLEGRAMGRGESEFGVIQDWVTKKQLEAEQYKTFKLKRLCDSQQNEIEHLKRELLQPGKVASSNRPHKDLEQTREKLSQMESLLTDSENRVYEKVSQLKIQNVKVTELEADNARMKTELYRFQQASHSNRDTVGFKQKISDLQYQLTVSQAARAEAESKCDHFDAEYDLLYNAHEALKTSSQVVPITYQCKNALPEVESQLQSTKDALVACERKLRDAGAEMIDLKKAACRAEGEAEGWEEEAVKVNREVSALRTEISRLGKEQEASYQLRSQLQSAKDALVACERKLRDAGAEVIDLKKAACRAEGEAEGWEEEAVKVNREVSALRTEISRLGKEQEASYQLRSQLQSAKDALVACERKLRDAGAEMIDLKKAACRAEGEAEGWEEEAVKVKREVSALRTEISRLGKEQEASYQLRSQLQSAKDALVACERKLRDAGAEMIDLKKAARRAEGEAEGWEQEAVKVKREVSTLRREISRLGKEQEASYQLRSQLQSAKDALVACERKLRDAGAEVIDLKKAARRAEGEAEGWEQEAVKVKREVSTLRTEISRSSTEQQTPLELSRVKCELQSTNDALAVCERKLRDAGAEVVELKIAASRADGRAMRWELEAANQSQTVNMLGGKITQLTRAESTQRREANEERRKAYVLQQEIDKFRAEKDALLNKLGQQESSQMRVLAQKNGLDSFHNNVNQQAAEANASESELSAARGEIVCLKQSLDTMKNQLTEQRLSIPPSDSPNALALVLEMRVKSAQQNLSHAQAKAMAAESSLVKIKAELASKTVILNQMRLDNGRLQSEVLEVQRNEPTSPAISTSVDQKHNSLLSLSAQSTEKYKTSAKVQKRTHLSDCFFKQEAADNSERNQFCEEVQFYASKATLLTFAKKTSISLKMVSFMAVASIRLDYLARRRRRRELGKGKLRADIVALYKVGDNKHVF
ncbi:hypothetical protein DICA4_A05248 [Diutina catenulata]